MLSARVLVSKQITDYINLSFNQVVVSIAASVADAIVQ